LYSTQRLVSIGTVLALAVACGSAAPAAAQETTAPDPAAATKVVDELHAAMLDVMKNADALGYEGRLAKLEPAIASRYDFPFIAEKSVGREWKNLDEASRTKLVDAMERLAGATYAARMDGFSGEKFETLGSQPAAQSTIVVRSQIVEPDGKTTSLDYRLRNDATGKPLIVDVFFDGTVSELAMRRSEYSALLKKGGVAELLAALDKKIAEQKPKLEGASGASLPARSARYGGTPGRASVSEHAACARLAHEALAIL
jgi:phospholipid transport system substrate-binding protein